MDLAWRVSVETKALSRAAAPSLVVFAERLFSPTAGCHDVERSLPAFLRRCTSLIIVERSVGHVSGVRGGQRRNVRLESVLLLRKPPKPQNIHSV